MARSKIKRKTTSSRKRKVVQSNPVNTDTSGATEGVRFNGVSVLSGYTLEKMSGLSFPRDKVNCPWGVRIKRVTAKGGMTVAKNWLLRREEKKIKNKQKTRYCGLGEIKTFRGGGGGLKKKRLYYQYKWCGIGHLRTPTPTESVSTAQDVEISVAAALTILPLHIILP